MSALLLPIGKARPSRSSPCIRIHRINAHVAGGEVVDRGFGDTCLQHRRVGVGAKLLGGGRIIDGPLDDAPGGLREPGTVADRSLVVASMRPLDTSCGTGHCQAIQVARST